MSTLSEHDVKGRAGGPARDLRAPAVTIFRMILFPAIGAAIGFTFVALWWIPRMGLGEVQRIVALARHLDSPLEPAPTLALLGDSIMREGIDTRLFAESAPAGWQAENFGINACAINEVRLILPKVLAARPSAVAVGFHPADLGHCADINVQKAYAYAMGDYVAAWRPQCSRADLPDVSQATFEILCCSRLQQFLHFHSAPLVAFSDQVRMGTRRGLRSTAFTDWIDPHEMEISIHDARLDRHLQEIRGVMEWRLRDGIAEGRPLIENIAADIRTGGAVPILILHPLHPRLRSGMEEYINQLRDLLTHAAGAQQGIVINALDLLDVDEFADAVHPNAAGRLVYSRFLGEQLRANSAQLGIAAAIDEQLLEIEPNRVATE